MTPRGREVLHQIVEAYIQTGEPVASRSVARTHRDNLSPASIRNVMADLSDEGYLAQPHTSAGRVPTEKAFRSYVESIAVRRIEASEVERLRNELDGANTMEARVERSSHLLTEMTRGFGIAAAIPGSRQALDEIRLVALPDSRVLVIVVTTDHHVTNRLVTLDEPISQDELDSIGNYVNRNFSGWALEEVRLELKRRLDLESAAYDAILRKLTVLYSRGLLDLGLAPEVHMEGAYNLVGLDLHLTTGRMRELFRALEEKKKILQLLDRFLEHPAGELGVHVGLSEEHPALREFSLIGVPVLLTNGYSAVIAVLGPMRMNYPRVMSAVLHLGQAFHAS
jgi:heat-inducible transcriptional repressor